MPRNPTAAEWRSAEAAIAAYGKARTQFRKAQEELADCGLLQGNDNKVGAAGEFWAIKFYVAQGYEITEVPKSNNAGYDFQCKRPGTPNVLRVSVKVVTDESKNGTQLRLKASPLWDVLFVVLLTKELSPYKRGWATREQFDRAIEEGVIGKTPQVARSNLKPNGWITQYGKTEDWA